MSNSVSEHVYAMTHPLMPGIVKIGMTTTPPEQHARELSASNIVPGNFELLCAIEMNDAPNLEAEMHQIFAAHRVKDQNFFEVDVEAVLWAFHMVQHHAPPYDHDFKDGARATTKTKSNPE